MYLLYRTLEDELALDTKDNLLTQPVNWNQGVQIVLNWEVNMEYNSQAVLNQIIFGSIQCNKNIKYLKSVCVLHKHFGVFYADSAYFDYAAYLKASDKRIAVVNHDIGNVSQDYL